VLDGDEVGTAAEVKLLNVSYDPTRELYAQIDTAFAKQWQAKTGQKVVIEQSHGGSGKPSARGHRRTRSRRRHARARVRRDAIAKAGLVAPDWQKRLPHRARRIPPRSCSSSGRETEGHPRLGRPDQGRRAGHHAEPQDVGRRALELSRRVGLRAAGER